MKRIGLTKSSFDEAFLIFSWIPLGSLRNARGPLRLRVAFIFNGGWCEDIESNVGGGCVTIIVHFRA